MCKLVHLLFWHWLITTALATSAELSITGSSQLNTWEKNGHKKVYHYNFTTEEYIKLKCAFKRTATMPAEFTLSFYMDGERQVRETIAHRESKFNADKTHVFRIEKRSKVITCVAERVSGWAVDGEDDYEGEVRLHYRPPAPEQTRVISTQQPALTKDPCVPNPCGSNSICNSNNGQVACSCLPDFLGAPPNCRHECTLNSECGKTKICSRQKCINPCTNACGKNAECRVVNNTRICSCPQGFKGNPLIECLVVDTLTKDPCVPNPCGSNSTCNSNNGQVACSCLPDFVGSPPNCRLECTLNSECGTTKTCSRQKCINPCTNACGENAECRVVNHTRMCSCPRGFEGNPFIECLVVDSTTPHQPDLETTSAISATPAERTYLHPTSDTDQMVSVDTGARVSVTLWVITALTVAIIIIAALIAAVLKYRAIVQKLESNRIPEHMRNRPPLTLPPEIVYDHVYSHGAGLLRPPLKPM